MKKLIALTVLFATGVAAIASTRDDNCYGECGESTIFIQAFPGAKYGTFKFESTFNYSCIPDNSATTCAFSFELVIYQSSNDPAHPWTKYSDTWYYPTEYASFIPDCGTFDQVEDGFWPNQYLTPGYSYIIQFNVYSGNLNDAREGLLDVCSTAQTQQLVPQRTGP